ncbi:hypothetical protein B0H16DRAFT_1469321 [Mycena metata]|uniref:Uncharacterized protein n=1 Tax=Mycena metata TaxID=1033252 RepID=A0AAD7MUD4_9AGAR|nr:hypothetical protein B0H16DRAFT_1469321 [Mycena metata]
MLPQRVHNDLRGASGREGGASGALDSRAKGKGGVERNGQGRGGRAVANNSSCGCRYSWEADSGDVGDARTGIGAKSGTARDLRVGAVLCGRGAGGVRWCGGAGGLGTAACGPGCVRREAGVRSSCSGVWRVCGGCGRIWRRAVRRDRGAVMRVHRARCGRRCGGLRRAWCGDAGADPSALFGDGIGGGSELGVEAWVQRLEGRGVRSSDQNRSKREISDRLGYQKCIGPRIRKEKHRMLNFDNFKGSPPLKWVPPACCAHAKPQSGVINIPQGASAWIPTSAVAEVVGRGFFYPATLVLRPGRAVPPEPRGGTCSSFRAELIQTILASLPDFQGETWGFQDCSPLNLKMTFQPAI